MGSFVLQKKDNMNDIYKEKGRCKEMKVYRRILKGLLCANVMFVLIAASCGYQEEQREKEIAKTNATLSGQQTDNAKKILKKKVIPVGKTVGIYINTQGILVIDTGEVTDVNGKKSNPAKNRLIKGDYIRKLNGKTMETKKQLIQAITDCKGESLVFDVLRKGEKISVQVEPVETGSGVYKVGIWVRDDLQGLGTITYAYGNHYGALGHSITDVDTGELLQVSGGEIYAADIFGVEKGIAGTPGEIEGMISYQKENIVGNIEKNRLYGIFGNMTENLQQELQKEKAMPIATMDEIKKGKAYIQSYVSGKKQLYEIEIVNIHRNDNGDKEMELKVTDDSLIDLTGGIVQGMSGSPILQNDKMIGAVTHVFVNDPTRGYAILIENMISNE